MIEKNTPEGQFLLVVWRTMIGLAGPISEQYRWMLTGIAAILAVIIGNLKSIEDVVDTSMLRVSVGLLVASLLLASIAYLLSVALRVRSETMNSLETILGTEAAQNIVNQMQLEPKEIQLEMCKPFFGPMGWIMRSAAKRGGNDPFFAEKGSIRMIVWQAYSMWAGMILAAIALILLVMGLR